jgi:hypothetical protein
MRNVEAPSGERIVAQTQDFCADYEVAPPLLP